ncbi:nucleotidyltransferase domain-containing protein [Methylobacter sp. sgz302048]|uniref:nucleotidyltransferase domain-containing protein n=1 Tax=Methylobacter sp. sgz302048 TaxID=3455945 RepID=UPI003F9F99BB
MSLNHSFLLQLWEQSRQQLYAQLGQRQPSAVFLEGSIAEGFGNERSDIDFVAIIDDGTEMATMPYILFLENRRVEVRLLSRERLQRELLQVKEALNAGIESVAQISWNQLERCQRFIGCLPIENEACIKSLQDLLGKESLGRAVALWFEDFARQTGRYAVAMLALEQDDYARAWIKTSVFHAAKSFVAQRGERYLGSKWLSLQLDRAQVDKKLVQRFWDFYTEKSQDSSAIDYLHKGIALLEEFSVSGVELNFEKVLADSRAGVSTWQIGRHLHILRDEDIFRLDDGSARVWRRIIWNTPCIQIAHDKRSVQATTDAKNHLADFSRAGLISLCWGGEGEIRARQLGTSCPLLTGKAALISVDGARLSASSPAGIQLLPVPARRLAEAGVELTWANIGVENSREDSEGALRSGQLRVLQYTLQRMIQTASMVALAGYGITPQPPLEEAVLEALRLLPLNPSLVEAIQRIETESIHSREQGQELFELAGQIVRELRQLGGDEQFPASFDTASGWCETVMYGYDWINLATHLNARFPASAVGGRGSAEEARDLLASNIG